MKNYKREPKLGELIELRGKHNRRWRRRYSWIVLDHGTFRLRDWRFMRKTQEQLCCRRRSMRDRNLTWKWRRRNGYSQKSKAIIYLTHQR